MDASYHSRKKGRDHRDRARDRNSKGRRGGRGSSRGRIQNGNYEDRGNEEFQGRPVRPPGLRGKDIGMFYAQFSKKRREDEEKKSRPLVSIDQDLETRVVRILNGLKTEECQPQNEENPNSAACVKQSNDLLQSLNLKQDFGDAFFDEACDMEFETLTDFEAYKRSAKEDVVPPKDNGLARDIHLDRKFLNKENEASRLQKVEKLLSVRQKLPSFQKKAELLKLIKENQVLVISGETGCGKTTQVPQFVLEDAILAGLGSTVHIICTQPRRISAISVAERVAQERGEALGESVGYHIRLENRSPRSRGSLKFCTTGILLQVFSGNPFLTGISHIVLDEIHERDLQSDFLMIILRDLLHLRTDLKVILMSATLNAEQFSDYFGGCPMINIPGFSFPVEEFWLEDIIQLLDYRVESTGAPQRRWPRQERFKREEERESYEEWVWQLLPSKYTQKTRESLVRVNPEAIDIDLCACLIRYLCIEKDEGAILVFLPGWEMISKLNNSLCNQSFFKNHNYIIIPLHSLMPTLNQRQVFDRPPKGVRKIILATNIAETSITIDDVVFVLDCGKIKLKDFDAENNLSTLKAMDISLANAKQRRGRAGRVQPGVCYHLYTDYQRSKFSDYLLPEIQRTRLEELCLQVKLLNLGPILDFLQKAMQAPSQVALQCSLGMLRDIHALDASENLTALGYHLAKMPVDPQTGKLLLFGAIFSCLDPILTVAANLSFKDAFMIPLGKEREADARRRHLAGTSKSDHVMLIRAYHTWENAVAQGNGGRFCYENFLSASTLQMLKKMRKQFCTLLHQMKFLDSGDPKHIANNRNSDNWKVVKAIICAGLYPNVAKITRGKKSAHSHRPNQCETKSDSKVEIHPKSVNYEEANWSSRWLVYHLKMKTTKVYLYDCGTISPMPILFFGGEIRTGRNGNDHIITVDDWIIFRTGKTTGKLLKELRSELNKYLERKINDPRPTQWNDKSESSLMNCILELISTEHLDAPEFFED